MSQTFGHKVPVRKNSKFATESRINFIGFKILVNYISLKFRGVNLPDHFCTLAVFFSQT